MDSVCHQLWITDRYNLKSLRSILIKYLYVSATPGDYELENSPEIIEQIIRPTGLLRSKNLSSPN